MASFSYRCNTLHHNVFQPKTIPQTHRHAPCCVQIEVTIAIDLIIFDHDCLTGQFSGYNNYTSQETHRFDLHVLKNRDQAYEILGAMLSRFEHDPASLGCVHLADDIIDDIILHGVRIGNQAYKRGLKVLPLCTDIWGVAEKHENDERVSIRRVLEESALANNYGMVLAEESAVKKMLKRVRLEDGDQCAEAGESNKKRKVKESNKERKDKESNKKRMVEGEDCVICLEEMKFGSYACQMPCSHTFHAACIKQWLKQSHYCPICRFEMPISES